MRLFVSGIGQTVSGLATGNWELATAEGLECSILFNQYEPEAGAEDNSRRRHTPPIDVNAESN